MKTDNTQKINKKTNVYGICTTFSQAPRHHFVN